MLEKGLFKTGTLIVCTAGILINKNRILLGKRQADRKLYPDTWDLPGGHCQDNETPDNCLIRELKEELGINITEFNYLTLFHEPKIHLYGEHDYHIYAVTNWSGVARNLMPNEHSEIRWFTLDDAIQLDLAHQDYPAIFKKLNNH